MSDANVIQLMAELDNLTKLQNIFLKKLLYYNIQVVLILINTEKLSGLLVKGVGNVNIRSELLDLVKLMIKSKDVPHTQVAAVIQDAVVDYLAKRGYYPSTHGNKRPKKGRSRNT